MATLPCDVLSAFLAFCDRVVYSHYLTESLKFSLSPLQDQECAGALMWMCATFIYLIPAVVVTVQLLSSSASDAAELERAGLHRRRWSSGEPWALALEAKPTSGLEGHQAERTAAAGLKSHPFTEVAR
jgi:hypothetical protein